MNIAYLLLFSIAHLSLAGQPIDVSRIVEERIDGIKKGGTHIGLDDLKGNEKEGITMLLSIARNEADLTAKGNILKETWPLVEINLRKPAFTIECTDKLILEEYLGYLEIENPPVNIRESLAKILVLHYSVSFLDDYSNRILQIAEKYPGKWSRHLYGILPSAEKQRVLALLPAGRNDIMTDSLRVRFDDLDAENRLIHHLNTVREPWSKLWDEYYVAVKYSYNPRVVKCIVDALQSDEWVRINGSDESGLMKKRDFCAFLLTWLFHSKNGYPFPEKRDAEYSGDEIERLGAWCNENYQNLYMEFDKK